MSLRLLALPLVLLAFHASIQPLPAPLRAELNGRFWHPGCPVPLARLRLLTVTHWGFDGRAYTGQLVVNEDAAAPLARVFRRLYELRFPIRHMRLARRRADPGRTEFWPSTRSVNLAHAGSAGELLCSTGLNRSTVDLARLSPDAHQGIVVRLP